ncbi:suppressor of fused domain protein [Hahella sp. CR1]|uniref:suppressor of fused domain protein n=1 Tax=Hahella sp. CR1 TaxID=2992807 RepID=UPI00244223E9|nr:suppressor of fused domain protein [Hahella sp. CR1]MDG9670971.1 suppressor of fused domain protein [Hahella sp. CR1]
MSFLEESWEEREEILYKEIFGNIGPGIYPLSVEIFNGLNANSVDPRWLSHGVFKCPPARDRDTWAYVTSGMSNPWETDKREEYSGLGVEFLMETENEEQWAVEVLQTLMGYNLLLAAGRMGDFPPLYYGDRVPLVLSESVKTMMFIQPVHFPCRFSIKSGNVDLIQVVGITPSELQAAKQLSSEETKEKLISNTGRLVTCKERESVA